MSEFDFGQNQLTSNIEDSISKLTEVKTSTEEKLNINKKTAEAFKEISIPKDLGNALTDIIDLDRTFNGDVVKKINDLIASKLKFDLLSGNDLGLNARMREKEEENCSIGDMALAFSLKGINIDLQGYALAGLLSMLICSGVKEAIKALKSLMSGDTNINKSVFAKAIVNTMETDLNKNSIGFIKEISEEDEVVKEIIANNSSVKYSVINYVDNDSKFDGSSSDKFKEMDKSIKIFNPNYLQPDNEGSDINISSILPSRNIIDTARKASYEKVIPMEGSTHLKAGELPNETIISLIDRVV